MENQQFRHILVCDSTFKLGSDITSEIAENIAKNARIFIKDNQICLEPWKKHEYRQFLEGLIYVRDTLKAHKISFSPKIIAVLYNTDGQAIGASIKTTAKSVPIETGIIKASLAKSDASKPKSLTAEEKIELVRKWRVEHPKAVPQPNEKYGTFAIGKFYSKACTDAELKARLDQILTE